MVAKPSQRTPTLFPVKKSDPVEDIREFIIFLYGRQKVGKTSFAAEFPDTLFLSFEPGTKALSVFGIPVKSWKQFTQIVEDLEKEPRFKTVCVDTVDIAYDMCEDHVCKLNGWDHPGDAEYGKGYKAVKKELAKWFLKLAHQGRGAIFLSHEGQMSIRRKGGSEVTRIHPSVGATARSVLEKAADIYIYYGQDDDSRYLQVVGDEVVTAGHRLQGRFEGQTRINAGKSAREAYENFLKAFRNEKSSRDAKATARPASKVRVAKG